MYSNQNDWGQRDIINKIIILNKWGIYRMYAIIMTKYQYLNMQMFWLKQINRLMGVYTIWFHMTLTVLQSTYLKGPNRTIDTNKGGKIPLLNKKDIKEPNAIIQSWRTFMCGLSRDLNNTPKTNTNRLKDLGRNWHR